MKLTTENIIATLVRLGKAEECRGIADFAIEVEVQEGYIELNFAEDEIALVEYPGVQFGVGRDEEVDQHQFKSFVGIELISPDVLSEDEKSEYDSLIRDYEDAIRRVADIGEEPPKSSKQSMGPSKQAMADFAHQMGKSIPEYIDHVKSLDSNDLVLEHGKYSYLKNTNNYPEVGVYARAAIIISDELLRRLNQSS